MDLVKGVREHATTGSTYHGKDDSALSDQLLEASLWYGAKCLQRITPRHGPVGIDEIHGFLGRKVFLEVRRHG